MKTDDPFQRLINVVSTDTLILTPNRRLSRFVVQKYNSLQSADVWPTLACMPLQSWLESQWSILQRQGKFASAKNILLSDAQAELLWTEIINQSEHGLLVPERMAKLAHQAWQILRQWNYTPYDIPMIGEENQLFQQWALEFTSHCQSQGWIDRYAMQAELCRGIQEDKLALPKHVLLFAFDDFTPLQDDLQILLRDKGVQVDGIDLEQDSNRSVIDFSSENDELVCAAQWASSLIQEHGSAIRIGIVIPDLLRRRQEINRIFTDVFEPQSIFPQNERHAPGFNLSASPTLNEAPIIRSVFLLLRLSQHSMDSDQLAELLHSPFLSVEEEFSRRAILIDDLRQNYVSISIRALRTTAGEANDDVHEERCPDLYRRLHALHQLSLKQPLNRHRKPSEWSALFSQHLSILGWPGTRQLDVLERQLAARLPELLQALSSLDLVCDSLPFEEAIKQLVRLAEIPFQAQAKVSAVQVLGVLEAAGLQFDYLWMLQMDNQHWPMVPSPNPLLPLSWQRENNMPRSSSERELAFSQRLFQRLSRSAKRVIFSYATGSEDRAQEPSHLLQQIPSIDLADLKVSVHPRYQDQLLSSGDIEHCLDNHGPVVADAKNVRGGSQVLKDQSACAFRAFAIHRLNATIDDDATLGINPMERGILIHRALEIIWRKLRNQKALLALSREKLSHLVVEALDKAWSALEKKQLFPAIKHIENRLIETLLHAWLELEKTRPDFQVAFNEAKSRLRLGKLQLNIRYDRVDRVTSGALMVIDYKTGMVSSKSWAGERPDEPQVPLYSIAQKDVQAAAFGQINIRGVEFKGLAKDLSFAPGLKTPELEFKLDFPPRWEDLLAQWRLVLTRLAKEFLAGNAQADPKLGGLTCRYCDLSSLCRIKSNIDIDEEELEALIEQGALGEL